MRRTRLPARTDLKLDDTVAVLSAIPYSDGNTIGPITFTAGSSATTNHLIGRAPQGWFPLRVTGGYGSFYETASDTNTITIKSANACTAYFWVY